MEQKNQQHQLTQQVESLKIKNQKHQQVNKNQLQEQKMIANRLKGILQKIQSIRNIHKIAHPVQLVAVSKTKTVEEIKQAYDAGQRHFGENYVDQIEDKHNKLANDIKWHFIGHLQSNKIKKVVVPNLYVIETVDRESLAEKLQKHMLSENRILNILIQVRTSDQDSKNGCEIQNLDQLYEYILTKCPNLKFKGLMTIGKQGDLGVFQKMYNIKIKMCQKYKLSLEEFQLSMGMSGDFQTAIINHSTSVRIGSSIFGARNYPKKAKTPQKINQTKI